MSNNSLNDYGKTFQHKVICAILTDTRFLNKIIDIIIPNYFDSIGTQWIIEKIKEYYKEYKTKPTMDFLTIHYNREEGSLKKSIKSSLLLISEYARSEDLEFVKDEILKFCKNKSLEQALNESVDLLSRGNYQEIRRRLDKALQAGQDTEIGHIYKEDIDKRYSEENLKVLPTRWEAINSIMKGGLPNGGLGMIIGGSGGGKSWLLCDLGEYALEKGYNVNHYTLELRDDYVAKRYDTIYTKQDEDTNLNNIDSLKEKISKLKGDLTVKFYPMNSVSLLSIRGHIERCILMNKKPDMVILDYPELLKMSGKNEPRQSIDDIYKDLKGMAAEYDFPIWVVSQTNREGYKSDIVKGEHISEHFGKIFHCDVVIGWSRPDKDGTDAYCHLIKNRYGIDGITLNSTMDTQIGDINISNEKYIDGEEKEPKLKIREKYLHPKSEFKI